MPGVLSCAKGFGVQVTPDPRDAPDRRVFDRADWVAAGVTSLAALIIYFVTLAPNVTLEQSGAFVVAGQYCGVGRVPGYPLWHLLAKCFISIFSFVRYRGHPNPAWATNFMSAFFGALSCGLVALLVARTSRSLSRLGEAREKACAVAVIAGVIFATGNTMWSQSVITETHTLTLFFILLFLAASLAWIKRPDRSSAFAMAAAFGFGFAQSQIIALLFPPLLLALLLIRPRLGIEFCVANLLLWTAPLVVFFSRYGNTPCWFLVSLGLCGMLVLLFVLLCSSDKGTLLGMVLLVALGAAFYAYLPLASEGGAPMQFGYPRTWEGFKHTILRGQYERIVFAHIFSLSFLAQLGWYLRLLNCQFIFPLGLLAFLPFIRILRLRGSRLRWAAVAGLTFFMFSAFLVAGASPKGDIQDSLIQRVKFIPSFAIWSVLVGLGLMVLIDSLAAMIPEPKVESDQDEP